MLLTFKDFFFIFCFIFKIEHNSEDTTSHINNELIMVYCKKNPKNKKKKKTKHLSLAYNLTMKHFFPLNSLIFIYIYIYIYIWFFFV